jgi:S1-C subfamily serine protease
MSGEWFHEPERRSSRNWYPAIMVILIILNVSVLGYIWLDYSQRVSGLNSQFIVLNSEISSLKAQLATATNEIASLMREIGSQPGGNYTVSNAQLNQIYNQTRESVVLIVVTISSGKAQGSGFVYDKQGRIITNNHVVEGASQITVTFIDGTVSKATVVGRDPYSDMAVIKVDVPADKLKPVNLGRSSDLVVGDYVVAIGNPYGLADSMTLGIVSAVGREMDATGNYKIVDVIQTDAAINPGNSGGPLLNMRGEVVGINTAILSETNQFSGIGFAIPSDTIIREIGSLKTGSYAHPLLGITGTDLTPGIIDAMNLPVETKGALVVSVTSGGPCAAAGIRGSDRQVMIDGTSTSIGGDVITAIDGTALRTFYDLMYYMERNNRPDDVVELTIIRGGSTIQVDVTLGTRPAPVA